MNIVTRLFVTSCAWIPLLLWMTGQPEIQPLVMWPLIDAVMVGVLLTLGSAAAFILLPPRPAPYSGRPPVSPTADVLDCSIA